MILSTDFQTLWSRLYEAGKLARSHVQMAACADSVVGHDIQSFHNREGNRRLFQQK